MHRYADIPISDLLLDPRNARLIDEQEGQQAALIALAKQQGRRLIRLAGHIAENRSLDPISLPAVFPLPGDRRKRFGVVEGNRRVVALKALETPSVLDVVFSGADRTALQASAERFASAPIATVHCAVFDTEAEAIPWVRLRHTGANQGAGLVDWGADEQDRFNTRHGDSKRRSTAGQVIDFVESAGLLSDQAKASKKKIITNVQRLINRPKVRERLGIAVEKGELRTYHSREQTARALTRLVEDLLLERINVRSIYTDAQRDAYATRTFPAEFAPNPSARLAEPVPLDAAPRDPTPTKRAVQAKKPKRRVDTTDRATLVPAGCDLNIPDRRIHNLYVELRGLSVDDYPNACSVTLRVFLELSADYYNLTKGVMTEAQLQSRPPLAKKIKDAATHLRDDRKIKSAYCGTLHTLMDQRHGVLAASAPTLHSYVHDRYIFPKPRDLKLAWDELQDFVVALWP